MLDWFLLFELYDSASKLSDPRLGHPHNLTICIFILDANDQHIKYYIKFREEPI